MIRNALNRGDRVQRDCSEGGRTRQSMRDECDVNLIVGRYQRTGILPEGSSRMASYGFAPALELQEALETVAKAQSMFMDLPSKVRRRFDNDPVSFLAFLQEPENYEEAIELGLAERPATDAGAGAEEAAEGSGAAASQDGGDSRAVD